LLVLSSGEETDVQQALEEWVLERGWVLNSVPAEERGEWLQHAGLQAVAILETGVAPEILAEGPPQVPLVVVGDAGLEAGDRVSTVGEPGARHDQAAFLAGAMAGLASENWVVALVGQTGGEHEAVYEAAFVHGVRYTCAYCWVVQYSIEGLTSDGLRANRVDVGFSIPGLASRRGFAQLAQAGIWVVWIGTPPEEVPVEQLAGGVVFSPETLVPLALESLIAGEPGQAWPYQVENGGLQVSSLNPEAISPGRERVLEAAREALANGELDVGVDPVTGEER
jgi:hypothetical protein